MNNTNDKTELEKQFNELMDKARETYPDIDDCIASYDNITEHTNELNEYIGLTAQSFTETTSNQVTI